MAAIVKFGYPVLRSVAKNVTAFDKELMKLLDKMQKVLYSSSDGAALAAPQIGVEKRVIVVDYEDEYLELVNPEIIAHSAETILAYEGCLSLPDYWGKVARSATVSVAYNDRHGKRVVIEKSEAMARCLQHEIDHLNGILFIDRMDEDFVETADKKGRMNVASLQRKIT